MKKSKIFRISQTYYNESQLETKVDWIIFFEDIVTPPHTAKTFKKNVHSCFCFSAFINSSHTWFNGDKKTKVNAKFMFR